MVEAIYRSRSASLNRHTVRWGCEQVIVLGVSWAMSKVDICPETFNTA